MKTAHPSFLLYAKYKLFIFFTRLNFLQQTLIDPFLLRRFQSPGAGGYSGLLASFCGAVALWVASLAASYPVYAMAKSAGSDILGSSSRNKVDVEGGSSSSFYSSSPNNSSKTVRKEEEDDGRGTAWPDGEKVREASLTKKKLKQHCSKCTLYGFLMACLLLLVRIPSPRSCSSCEGDLQYIPHSKKKNTPRWKTMQSSANIQIHTVQYFRFFYNIPLPRRIGENEFTYYAF